MFIIINFQFLVPRGLVSMAFTMAQQVSSSIRFSSVRLLQDAPFGRGAYGQVWKAMLGDLPCAGKLLHPILMDPANRAMFERECSLLSEIRHPNIVQYLGATHDPVTGVPILLMELMHLSMICPTSPHQRRVGIRAGI